jgi:hypothetical protein
MKVGGTVWARRWRLAVDPAASLLRVYREVAEAVRTVAIVVGVVAVAAFVGVIVLRGWTGSGSWRVYGYGVVAGVVVQNVIMALLDNAAVASRFAKQVKEFGRDELTIKAANLSDDLQASASRESNLHQSLHDLMAEVERLKKH